jgi:hypothetical protein
MVTKGTSWNHDAIRIKVLGSEKIMKGNLMARTEYKTDPSSTRLPTEHMKWEILG